MSDYHPCLIDPPDKFRLLFGLWDSCGENGVSRKAVCKNIWDFFSDPGFTVVPPGLHGDAVPGQGKQALCLRALQAQIGGGRPKNSFQTPMPVKAA